MEYAELHCHSSFSLLDGASIPEELICHAKSIGIKALALTDHDDLGGIPQFAHAGKEYDLAAIVGAELSMEDDSHLTLLAQDIDGYKNLCHLITKARSNNLRGTPKTKFEDLYSKSSGLVVLTGCPHGAIPRAIARGEVPKAQSNLLKLKDVFRDNLFVEIWNHHIAQEQAIAKQLIELADICSVDCVVTNNVHYANRNKRIIHDVLTCLKYGTTLEAAGRRLRPNDDWSLKAPDEMHRIWRAYPRGLRNTLVVAERCQFRLGLLKYSLPVYPLPESFESHDSYLRYLTQKGAEKRFEQLTDVHLRQIEHELALISKLGLAPYFLIMWDIVNFAQSQNIAIQGRGSAANSVVCYALYITPIDPIAMDLFFERFLSEGRGEPPDIDLDIAHEEREKIIQYVYNKYGRQHAAMVCETITYRGKSAVRDAAFVLGFSPQMCDKLASLCSHREARASAVALLEGNAAKAGLDINDKRTRMLVNIVAGLHQLPRHRSIHVGGFVLSGEPLGNYVPVEPAAMSGRTIIQWDKDDLELTGMIKIDLLGLGMLTMIHKALSLVKEYRQVDIDPGKLNGKDPAVYEMLRRADTIGVFQIESRAQMSILPRLKPDCFYDIVVSIALIRPGPIQGNVVHPYVRRRRGLEATTYAHPDLKPILERTYGVPLFQEQGMKVAMVAAGFSATQADQLRRIMSYKRSTERMDNFCKDLAVGMRANNYSQEAIATIIQHLQAFADFGFPESHAASFAVLAYASAYLKCHYAPEFYCALLNSQPMGFYSPDTIIRDAARHNVEIRSVDITKSSWDCTLERDDAELVPSMRIGLRYIKELGKTSKIKLEEALKKGAFRSVEDVVEHSGLDVDELTALTYAGALSCFEEDRRQTLWKILVLKKQAAEGPLFKQLMDSTGAYAPQPLIGPMNQLEQIDSDYQAMGLSTGPHPMTFHRQWALVQGIKTCRDLLSCDDGVRYAVAGAVICRQRPPTAKGVVFITLEDETGIANIIIRPDVFEQNEDIIGHSYLVITGKLQLTEGVCNLMAERIVSMQTPSNYTNLLSRNFH